MASILQTYAYVFVAYGGDAFVAGHASGSGPPGLFHVSTAYQASYALTFLDSAGNPLAGDATGPIFTSNGGCLAPFLKQDSYVYRRTVTAIPSTTRFIRFTATMTDTFSVCYANTAQSTFENGFDKLWLNLIYLGPDAATAREFNIGTEPGPSVGAVPTRGKR